MKSAIRFVIIIWIALSGCVENDDMCCIIEGTNELKGTWLWYEYGYSPGSGYFTEAVPAEPPQTITFGDHHVSSTITGWEQFKYYRILEDTVVHAAYLALYVDDPGFTTGSPSSELPTYSFDLRSDTLALYFRWCIEGCHNAFRKIE